MSAAQPLFEHEGLTVLRAIRARLEQPKPQPPNLLAPATADELNNHVRIWHPELDLGRYGRVADVLHEWLHDTCTTHTHKEEAAA